MLNKMKDISRFSHSTHIWRKSAANFMDLAGVPVPVIERFGEWGPNDVVIKHYLRGLSPQGLAA